MKTVIVTGASTGIGRSLALAWAARKDTVVLSARGREALEEVAREVEARGGTPIVEPGDVTDEGHRANLVARGIEKTGRIDVLVNNAGRGFFAATMKIDIDDMRRLFELNVVAPLRLTQLAMPHLAASRGTVVMMSSIAGVLAAPPFGAYAASKFALEALSTSMRLELQASGIRVVVIRPGPVATSFRANANREPDQVGFDKKHPPKAAQSPDTVAAITLRAVDRASPVVATSAVLRLMSIGAGIAPSAMRALLRRMSRPAQRERTSR